MGIVASTGTVGIIQVEYPCEANGDRIFDAPPVVNVLNKLEPPIRLVNEATALGVRDLFVALARYGLEQVRAELAVAPHTTRADRTLTLGGRALLKAAGIETSQVQTESK